MLGGGGRLDYDSAGEVRYRFKTTPVIAHEKQTNSSYYGAIPEGATFERSVKY